MAKQKQNNICIFDLETTGLNSQLDHIVQIGATLIDPEFNELSSLSLYCIPEPYRADWEVPQSASQVNGLTRQIIESKGGIRESEAIKRFIEFSEGCDYCGFNSNAFDVRFLYNRTRALGLNWNINNRRFFDVRSIENYIHGRTLVDLFRLYTGGKTMDEVLGGQAHDALTDVRATAVVLRHQMSHEKLDWSQLSEMDCNNLLSPEGSLKYLVSKDSDGKIKGKTLALANGKYKDTDILEVAQKDPQYIQWAVKNLFSDYSLSIIKKYIDSKTHK